MVMNSFGKGDKVSEKWEVFVDKSITDKTKHVRPWHDSRIIYDNQSSQVDKNSPMYQNLTFGNDFYRKSCRTVDLLLMFKKS